MITTTETLIEKLAAGDGARWARFYRDYAPHLEKYLNRKYPSLHDEIEDIISETMIDIAKTMPGYHYDKAKYGAFHSLLNRIAYNKAVDHLKKMTRETDALAKLAAEPPMISDDDWRRTLYGIALNRVMNDATIQDTTKLVFRRVVQLGEDTAKVAAELGIEPNAVYQIRDRMKKRLVEEVEKIQKEFPG